MKHKYGIGSPSLSFYLYWIVCFLCISFLFLSFFWKGRGWTSVREGFTWSRSLINQFHTFQNTVNPNTQFDLQMIQNQASEQEVKSLLENGVWPWSKNTDYLFLDAVSRNPILKINPHHSLDYSKTVYNENAAKQLLSWNAKEGKFLLGGGKGNQENSSIQCSQGRITKTSLDGYQLWNGYKNVSTQKVENQDIPKEMPGFHFIKEPCNPCVALDQDYRCPFQIRMKNDEKVSPIWKDLWGL